MKYLRKLKQRWKKFCLRAKWLPYDDAPIKVWSEFAKKAPRWLVEETAERWIKDFSSTYHWDAVYSLLRNRCDSFELPLLTKAFLQAHQKQICLIADKSPNSAILVSIKDIDVKCPIFIVEKCGKFRGIALSNRLVVAGVLNREHTAQSVWALQQHNKTYSLAQYDIDLLSEYKEAVYQMLLDAGVETLQGSYWYQSNGVSSVWNSTKDECLCGEEAFVIGKL